MLQPQILTGLFIPVAFQPSIPLCSVLAAACHPGALSLQQQQPGSGCPQCFTSLLPAQLPSPCLSVLPCSLTSPALHLDWQLLLPLLHDARGPASPLQGPRCPCATAAPSWASSGLELKGGAVLRAMAGCDCCQTLGPPVWGLWHPWDPPFIAASKVQHSLHLGFTSQGIRATKTLLPLLLFFLPFFSLSSPSPSPPPVAVDPGCGCCTSAVASCQFQQLPEKLLGKRSC